ncbi:hypothetical protein JB92DRAFT_2987991 [Gautieria morchelliformis]|nr:hypothetical protein JB92DRAFT_2987991 [Gautieria morchelliformis]
MAGIALDKAEIIAIFLETLLYGISLTLFCITLWVLVNKPAETKIRSLMLAIAISLFVLATAHIILDFIRILEAFIFLRDSIPGGPIGYYGNVSNPLHIAKTAVYTTQTLIGDSLVTWRCYAVYRGNKYVIIYPVTSAAVCAATGYYITWNLTNATPGSTIFQAGGAWITAFFVLTMSTNVYCTSLIVYRIWTSNRSVASYHQSSLIPVILALVESAGLYSSTLLALLIAYLANSNGQYPGLDTVMPVISIVFSLIILQISFGSSGVKGSTGKYSTREHASTARHGFSTTVPSYPLQAISVEISRVTNSDDTNVQKSSKDQKKSIPGQMWEQA